LGLNTTASAEKPSILLTFDVEDWFQVENFKDYIPFLTWDSFDLRVGNNTLRVLDLLDSFVFKPKATFFILGWIAQKMPDLVREIHIRGHEVASHGVDHHLPGSLSATDLAEDLAASKALLESIIQDNVYGFRAPSFAINDYVLTAIQKAGYCYDSSYNSFSGHGRYGTIDLSSAQQYQGSFRINDTFYELPVSNLTIADRVIPLGGGGYFRLLPFPVFKIGMEYVLKKDKAFVFYAHPWEFDPAQPRVNQASRGFKFRHYVNLHRTEKKLTALLNTFEQHDFITCGHYLKKIAPHSFDRD
jgi:polysaccharide deacetylase family protein (PEP-CTERM system associated)